MTPTRVDRRPREAIADPMATTPKYPLCDFPNPRWTPGPRGSFSLVIDATDPVSLRMLGLCARRIRELGSVHPLDRPDGSVTWGAWFRSHLVRLHCPDRETAMLAVEHVVDFFADQGHDLLAWATRGDDVPPPVWKAFLATFPSPLGAGCHVGRQPM